MNQAETKGFRDSRGGVLTIEEVAKELVGFMRAEDNRHYVITIGTDSQSYANGKADFVTAVVVHRVGSGGRYFWKRQEPQKFYTLRDRMLREVMISLDLGKIVVEALRQSKEIDFNLEIHVDVGEKGETNKMIQELVGLIRANDFEARTKPYSYAASSVADRHI